MLRKLTFFCKIGTHSVDFKIELHICFICLGIWVFKSELAMPEQQALWSLYQTLLLWEWPAHLVLVWMVVTPRGSFTSVLLQVLWNFLALTVHLISVSSTRLFLSPCHLPSIPAKYVSAPLVGTMTKESGFQTAVYFLKHWELLFVVVVVVVVNVLLHPEDTENGYRWNCSGDTEGGQVLPCSVWRLRPSVWGARW